MLLFIGNKEPSESFGDMAEIAREYEGNIIKAPIKNYKTTAYIFFDGGFLIIFDSLAF